MIHKVLKKEKGEYLVIASAIVLAGALAGLGSYLGGRAIGEASEVKSAYGAIADSGSQGAAAAQQQQAAGPSANPTVAPVTSSDHIRGSLNAKAFIVEYSDPECPFCKLFDPTLQQVMQKYGSQVAWVYRNFPIDSLHPKARNEAQATECAADLGGNDAFWKYYDRLFAVTPSNNGLDPAQLPQIAQYVGLDVNAFNSCLSSGKEASKVDASYQSGIAAGVNATPTSFIVVNGKVVKTIVGAVSLSEVEGDLDQALK